MKNVKSKQFHVGTRQQVCETWPECAPLIANMEDPSYECWLSNFLDAKSDQGDDSTQ